MRKTRNRTRATPAVRDFGRAALVIFLVAGMALANSDPKKGRVTENPMSGNRYTLEQEVQIGRQGAADVEKKLSLLPADHPMSVYINALGQKLAAKAPGFKFPYTFKVVNEKSVNAFALPGGPIYVHTGLIDVASESQLAAVMGHEISHVVMRHSTRQATKQMKARVPLAILSGVLGATVGGWAGALGQMGISFSAGTVFMKYSRDAETEADMVGAQIMYDAGYNPEAAVSFFNKLKQITGDKGGPQFLASHPDPGNRARDISQILSRFPPKQYQPEDSAEYLAAKQSLSNAAAKSEAATIPAAKPVETTPIPLEGVASNSFKTFDHDSFTISYPDNWSLTGDRSTAVTIYPKGGYVEGALAYGAMISGFRPDPPGKEPAAGFQQLIATTQQENPGLRLAGKPESFTLRGRPAQRVDLLGPSAVWENGQQVTERARMVALPEKHGEVLYAVFVAPDKDFQKLWPTFEQMLHSLQVK